MAVPPDPRRKRRDYSKPHRLFLEDTPVEVRAILEEAAAVEPIAAAERELGKSPTAPPSGRSAELRSPS